MRLTSIVVLMGALIVSGSVHAAMVQEEMRQAMENQPLEIDVDDPQLAMIRATEWLAETGHIPMPFGVTYLIHRHKGPQTRKEKLFSRCSVAGNAPPRRPQVPAASNPIVDRDALGPTTVADSEAMPLRLDWWFEVELESEGNTIRIHPAAGTNREMVSILARFIETGADACNKELTWLVDRPGHDPVAFDPVVHRQNPPTIDYRSCFSSPD